MLLFTTVNERSWVDQLTAPVKLAVFRPSQNQEKSESALPQLSRGLNNATWTRKSGQVDPPERRSISGSQRDMNFIGPQSENAEQSNTNISQISSFWNNLRI